MVLKESGGLHKHHPQWVRGSQGGVRGGGCSKGGDRGGGCSRAGVRGGCRVGGSLGGE